MLLKAKKKRNMNYINYHIDRIRLEIRRLVDAKKLKKITIYEKAGMSRPYLDNIINGKSDIDIRVLIAINELLDVKINWFDLSDEGIAYSLESAEDTIRGELNSETMTETNKEMLHALQLLTTRLEEISSDVKDLKETGS